MRATIERSFVESTIHGYSIETKDGKPTIKELEPLKVFGKITKEKALKELKKVHGKDAPVSVGTIDTAETKYVISVEDFVKYAKPVTGTEDQAETAQTEEATN